MVFSSPVRDVQTVIPLLSDNSPNREISLQDHIATVAGYLNDYKKASPNDKATYSAIFSDYITSVCWRKNHRRMNHWATIGLIGKLDRFSQIWDHLDIGKIPDAKPDPLLAKRLDNLEKQGKIGQSMEFLASRTHSGKLSELLKECQPDASHILFSQTTFKGFHDLFIAVHIAYAVLLRNMSKFGTIAGARRVFQIDANHVSNVAQLLTAILNSNALEAYLQFLGDTDALGWPTRWDPYAEFARLNLMEPVGPPRQQGCCSSDTCRDAGERKYGGEGVGVVEQTDLNGHTDERRDNGNYMDEGKGKRKDCGEGGDSMDCKDFDQGDYDIDEEERTFRGMATKPGVSIPMTHRWLKSSIGHYAAKRILEHYCAKVLARDVPGNDVKFHFLDGKGSRRQVANWEEMKQTMTRAISSETQLFQKNAIEYLQSEIVADGTDGIPIFSTFRALLRNETTFRHFVVQCETLLAAIAKYGVLFNPGADTQQSETEIMNILKVTVIPIAVICIPFTLNTEIGSDGSGSVQTVLSHLLGIHVRSESCEARSL